MKPQKPNQNKPATIEEPLPFKNKIFLILLISLLFIVVGSAGVSAEGIDDINISSQEKIKDAINVASMVIPNLSKDSNNFNDNNYLNFSIDNNNAESAPVASMVMHQPHKLGLVQRLPGSIPGWGVSAFDFSKTAKEVISNEK